jgi:Uma2 family endonuclease
MANNTVRIFTMTAISDRRILSLGANAPTSLDRRSQMAATVHYTIAELDALELPDNGVRYELIHGQLLVSPAPPSVKHQAVAARLAVRLAMYIGASRVGQLFTPGAVVFGDDSEFQPDVLVVPGHGNAYVTWRDIKEWWLAVEVLSPSTRQKDVSVKRDGYLECGIPEVWFADPMANTVTIIRRDVADVVLESEHTLTWQAPGVESTVTINLVEIFFGP